MIEVHHLEHSRSIRVVWLLEELAAPYKLIHYKRDPKSMLAPPALREIYPIGKSPIIRDGALVLAESGAILEYINETYGAGKLAPARSSPDYWTHLYWLHYAEGSAMPPLITRLIFQLLPGRSPALMRPFVRAISRRVTKTYLDREIAMHVRHWEQRLQSSPWFGGQNIGIADMQMAYVIEAADKRIGISANNKAIAGFLEKVRALPAYRKALVAVGEADPIP